MAEERPGPLVTTEKAASIINALFPDIALGATPRTVTLMVLRRTARFALSVAVIGIAASLALTRVLANSLF